MNTIKINRWNIKYGLWLGCFLLLNACALHQPNTSAINVCYQQCQQKLIACRTDCQHACTNCRQGAYQAALENYRAYLHEQAVQCKPVARELQSYRDPLQCRKTTCHCLSDYQICSQACRHNIIKQRRAPWHCN
ncbi:MAG: acyltransferase [Legionellaceae bacterium]|nr:acyltransferase [Legionellaceae bacterium]